MCAYLQIGAAIATCVPDAEHLDFSTVHSVVEKVMNPGQMQSPHAGSTGIRHRCPDARLDAKKRKSLREILVEGFRRKFTILIPLSDGPVNLRLRSLRDPDFHGSASHDDVRASQAPPPRTPFRLGLPRRLNEEAQLPPQA